MTESTKPIEHEIQQGLEMIRVIGTEIAELVKTLTSYLGEAFFREEIEHDEVWNNVDSDLYRERYLNHKFPSISQLAKMRLEISQIESKVALLMIQQDKLKQDKVHNAYMPVELYRMITSLQEEFQKARVEDAALIAELRAELNDLKEKEALREKSKYLSVTPSDSCNARFTRLPPSLPTCTNTLNVNYINFDLFSNPTLTSWNNETRELIYNGTGHNYAISSTPLPKDRPVSWRVKLDKFTNWVNIGVIGSLRGISSTSHSHSTSIGWAGSTSVVWIRGRDNPGYGGWPSWRQGDIGIFKYNPIIKQLSLNLERTGLTYTIDVGDMQNVYLHLTVYATPLSVQFDYFTKS